MDDPGYVAEITRRVVGRDVVSVSQGREEIVVERAVIVERDHGEMALRYVVHERRAQLLPEVLVPVVAPAPKLPFVLIRDQRRGNGDLADWNKLGPVFEEHVHGRLT